MALHDRSCPVSRGAVDDDILACWIGLGSDALDALLQIGGGVPGDRDDRNSYGQRGSRHFDWLGEPVCSTGTSQIPTAWDLAATGETRGRLTLVAPLTDALIFLPPIFYPLPALPS